MSALERHIYGAVLRLHPASFRDEFGRQMAHDFEDAVRARGFTPLLGDALLSLLRQWSLVCVALEAPQPVPAHPFLAGQYLAVDRGHLTLFDWASAAFLSALLVLTIGVAASIPNQHVIANVQSVRVGHDGGIDTGGNGPPLATNPARREAPSGEVIPLAFGNSAGRHSRVYLGRGRGATGPAWGPRATGGPTARPETLAEALFQFTLISLIIWITSIFLRRSSGIGRRAALATLGLLAIAASVAFGQAPGPPIHAQILHAADPLPSFEVATIKPVQPRPAPPPPPPPGTIDNRPPAPRKVGIGKLGGQQTDQVHVTEPAALLILFAYNLPFGSERTRIVAGPDWLYSVPYEIQAKIDDSRFAEMQKMTPDQQREQVDLMQQSLLADRFKLKVHFETREMPVYALVIGKGGSKLTPATDGETKSISSLNGELTAKAVTLGEFAYSSLWTPIGGRMVVDQTGLKGAYDFALNWSQEPPGQDGAPALSPIFAAIQAQLGLKLVPSTAPIEVIVIDHIEKPSEN